MKSAWIIIFMILLSLTAKAETEADSIMESPIRPVNSQFMIGVGKACVLDTYLSPLSYHGVNLQLSYERMQSMKFNPERWIMQMGVGVDYSNVKNPVGNRKEHVLMADFTWGMMRRWHVLPAMQFFAGGSTTFRGGVLYAPSNSNNVVSVKLHWSVNATAMAVYNQRLGKLPVTFRYQATLPIMGAFYSPEYGESYYEIYVGNHANLAHFAWWKNKFDMTNFLTADLHFNTTVLRLGYRGRIETSWINNLNTHIFTHSAVIGIGGEWMSLSQTKKMENQARVISAMY